MTDCVIGSNALPILVLMPFVCAFSGLLMKDGIFPCLVRLGLSTGFTLANEMWVKVTVCQIQVSVSGSSSVLHSCASVLPLPLSCKAYHCQPPGPQRRCLRSKLDPAGSLDSSPASTNPDEWEQMVVVLRHWVFGGVCYAALLDSNS